MRILRNRQLKPSSRESSLFEKFSKMLSILLLVDLAFSKPLILLAYFYSCYLNCLSRWKIVVKALAVDSKKVVTQHSSTFLTTWIVRDNTGIISVNAWEKYVPTLTTRMTVCDIFLSSFFPSNTMCFWGSSRSGAISSLPGLAAKLVLMTIIIFRGFGIRCYSMLKTTALRY
jgi:hypothetical protein